MSENELIVDISKCNGMDEVFSHNYRLDIPGIKRIYLNLERNEIKDERLISLLQKVVNGFYINTLGEMNLNKILKKF